MRKMKKQKMQNKRSTIVQTGFMVFLLLGLGLTLYLIQRAQTYTGRAELGVLKVEDTFTITPNDPAKPVTCSGTTCTTEAEEVTVQFNPTDQNIQDLLNAIP